MAYKYSIKAASVSTGLSPHVIRVWEKRYGAVNPERTKTNRRQYGEEDIERLLLLRRVTEAGHKIGQVANLPDEELNRLLGLRGLGPSPAKMTRGVNELVDGTTRHSDYLAELMDAVMRFDEAAFQESLSRAAVAMGRMLLLEEIVIPLIRRVDDMWNRGTLRIAHEHMVTAMLRSFLNGLDGTSHLPPNAPRLVITTPSGQVHELGALITASSAVMAGWNAIYLGADLPAEEICAVVIRNRASAVALSLVYPTDDPRIVGELRKLKKRLPGHVEIIVGGRALPSYLDVLHEINAKIITDMKTFCRHLEDLCVDKAVGREIRNPA
ncbi:MAG: MerR family transcriptional regulator [Planctomycetota bacterium]